MGKMKSTLHYLIVWMDTIDLLWLRPERTSFLSLEDKANKIERKNRLTTTLSSTQSLMHIKLSEDDNSNYSVQ